MKKLLFTLCLFVSLNAIGQVIIPADSLKKHVYFLASDSLEGRGIATSAGLKAANYIANHFEQIGLVKVGESYLHPFFHKLGSTMVVGNNIVGMVEGSDPVLKNEYIVLGAHFDHVSFDMVDGVKVVYNGADDNASGTSAIMELGRALVQHKNELKRSIVIVAFDGEESGLVGSGFFVKQAIVPIQKVKLMMSIDMVGRYAESKTLSMGAMATLEDGEKMLEVLAIKHGISIKDTEAEISNRTDSRPFGKAGIPALHVTTGVLGPYHKPEDDAETLDYSGMEKVSGLIYELTVVASNSDSLVPVKQLIAGSKKNGMPLFRVGAILNMGNNHHYYPNEFFNGKSKFSFETGLVTQFMSSEHLSLQAEVLYSSMASDFIPGNFRTHSISTPVSIVYGTRMNQDIRQRFFMSLGLYYSYNFAGTVGGKKMDFVNDFDRNESGIVCSLGLELMSVIVGVTSRYGLSNLSKSDEYDQFSNRGIYFTMGYIF